MTDTTAPRLLVPKRVVKPTTWGGKSGHFTNGGVVVYSSREEAQADADMLNAKLAAEMFARLDPASLIIPGTEALKAQLAARERQVETMAVDIDNLERLLRNLYNHNELSAGDDARITDALNRSPTLPTTEPLLRMARTISRLRGMVDCSRGQDGIARGYLCDLLHELTGEPLADCQ